VLGQEHVTRTLRNAVAADRVAHAYLLCGPRGTGKTSIARILFKAVNCLAPVEGDACNACDACSEVSAGAALDLIEIDAASNRGIDHIRELRERVWIAPARARRKMYILDEAHQLSAPAWDAFLKTLEEPPPHVVFVLATTEVHKVPGTIQSRCQRFDLGRIALSTLVSHLAAVSAAEGLEVEGGVLQRVARQSRGGVRDALGTLEQLAAYGGQRITPRTASEVLGLTSEEALRSASDALARGDARGILELVSALAREGADLRQFWDDLIGHLRALLLARVGAGDALAFEFAADEQAWFESEASTWEPARLVQLVRRLSALDPRGRDPGQFQVEIELAMLEGSLGEGESSTAAESVVVGSSWSSNVEARSRSEPHAAAAPPRAGVVTEDAALDSARSERPSVVSTGPVAGSSGPSERRSEATVVAEVDLAIEDRTVPPGPIVPSEQLESVARPTGGPSNGLEIAVVRHRWTELKEAVAEQLPKAGVALEAASVAALGDGELRLAFTSEFHQATIEETTCRAAVEQILADALGVRCRLRCVPAEAWQPTLPDDGFLRQAAELFGATGVEPVDDEPFRGEEQAP
jgi:DNA polymerase-3 subunit gamma/tau